MVGFELLREGYVWMQNSEGECSAWQSCLQLEGELVGGNFVENIFLEYT